MLLPERLKRLGFQRELFSDGWFWHKELPPHTPMARAAAGAIGAPQAAGEPILLQYSVTDHSWQGVLCGRAVSLTFKQSSGILSAMEEVL